LAAKAATYRIENGRYPNTLKELLLPGESKRGPYLKEQELFDPWGGLIHYRLSASGTSILLFSLGRDGRLGGFWADADLQVEHVAGES
jgi:hypothetical protein